MIRNNLGIGGKAELANNFTINGTLNFSQTDFKSPPVSAGDGNTVFGGGGSSVFSNVFFTPRNVDLMGLPYQNPLTGGSVYYRQANDIQHPLWTVYNASSEQLTNRVYGSAGIMYDFTDNLNLTYRLGIDLYNEGNTSYQNRGGSTSNTRIRSGFYDTWTNSNTIWDHNITLNGMYDLSEKLGLNFNLGATTRRTIYDRQGVSSSNQQVFDVLRHFNFMLQDEIQYSEERNIAGLYGQVELDYDGFLYVTINGRNDWVSNLSEDNRSIFYPGVSASFLPTSAFSDLSGDALGFLKLRAGFGTSANFPSGYPIANRLSLNTQRWLDDSGNLIVSNTTNSVLGNPDLEPETMTEIEFGVESNWFKNHFTLNASYFNRITENLLVNRSLDASTGYTSVRTNIGEINVEGLEIEAGLDIFKNPDQGAFNWSVNANFSTIEPTVKDLGQDTDIIVYSGFSNLGNAAIPDKPLGTIVGSRILRDDAGNFVTNSQGDYVVESGQFEIGDPNPDYTLNVSSSISLKNFNFNILVTHVSGGDIYSQTIATLLGRGLTTDTDNRINPFILPGVNQDTGEPNNIQINNSQYYFDNILFGPDELQVYDGSVIRLQEVSLGYSVPQSFLEKTPFGSLSLKVSGYNLWYDAYNTPDGINFDPNVAALGVGNGQGFDFLSGPSSKRYGISITASF